MNSPKFRQQAIGVIWVIAFLAGCAAPTAAPTLAPTFPPPPPPTLPSPPTPAQPAQPTGQPELFKFIQTVQVTPDDEYLGGGFARINYVPATDRFVVTFGGELAQPSGGCMGKAFAYKEYTLDMQETGKSGVFACDVADAGSVMVDNTYYFAAMIKKGQSVGWHLLKIDAVNWKTLVDTFFPIDYPKEGEADPMVAYVNGQIDISSAYSTSGKPPDPSTPAGSYGTHHQFFSTDLQFLGKEILTDPPHINGSYMAFVDGIYYLVTANLYDGDVLVAKYDKDWNYLGEKTLIKQAHWSTGLVYDGQRFYLAYTDTSQRNKEHFFPVFLNIHLAAFDRDWNLIDDVAVTDYTPTDNMQTGRPWVLLHGNRLYVSYDLDTMDPVTHQEQMKGQAIVSVYELTAQPAQPTGQAGTCSGNDVSALGVLRSTDHGATWTSLGNACMQNSTVWAVDPTGFMLDGRVVLYFVDFGHLNQPVPQSIYRATSVDGTNFDTPQAVYTQSNTMVDPFVLPLTDGSFRLYVPSDQEGMISALSRDGLAFTREGMRDISGGMPGALLLPDGRMRMFVNGSKDGHPGIFSLISSDGLTFTAEGGMRILGTLDSLFDNAQPIRLMDGSYLMLYQIHPAKLTDQPEPWTFTEIHLATSTDGLNWSPNPTIIGYGGTSCVVEMPDGTLLIYYVNR